LTEYSKNSVTIAVDPLRVMAWFCLVACFCDIVDYPTDDAAGIRRGSRSAEVGVNQLYDALNVKSVTSDLPPMLLPRVV
jgi:hypothetical protein